jgi:hypothetical protein
LEVIALVVSAKNTQVSFGTSSQRNSPAPSITGNKVEALSGTSATASESFDLDAIFKGTDEYLKALDANLAKTQALLHSGDEFLAGKSHTLPERPEHQFQLPKLPAHAETVEEPYHALQAIHEGRFKPSEGMQHNLETLIGNTGRDIREVAAEQYPTPGLATQTDSHQPKNSPPEIIQTESSSAKKSLVRTIWEKVLKKVLQIFRMRI